MEGVAYRGPKHSQAAHGEDVLADSAPEVVKNPSSDGGRVSMAFGVVVVEVEVRELWAWTLRVKRAKA